MTSKTFRELQELLWLAQYVPKEQLSPQPEDDDIEVSDKPIDVDERAGERKDFKEPAPSTEEAPTEVEGNQVQTSVEGEEDETPGVMNSQSAYRQSIEGRHEIAKPYSPLEIARTFRHMVIHSLVESDELLDVEETVHHSAQMQAIIPIFQDELYSDASLILLQDETDSMAPFQNLSIEFARIAEMYADFYTVRHARASQESLEQLSIQIPNPHKCFVLVISDGLSNLFVDGQILQLLSKYFPTGCKVIWVHPWERRYWPSEIHSLSSGRPSSWKGEATTSEDEDEQWMDSELVVQLVGLQNTSFQSILAFAHDKPLSWRVGKRIQYFEPDSEDSEEVSDGEEDDLSAFYHIQATVSEQAMLLLGIIAWLPSGRIDIALLKRIALNVLQKSSQPNARPLSETDVAMMIGSGALTHASDTPDRSNLVVQFSSETLRLHFKTRLLTSQVDAVFSTLFTMANEDKNESLTALGINLTLLLALRDGTDVQDAVKNAQQDGGLQTYLDIATVLDWSGAAELKDILDTDSRFIKGPGPLPPVDEGGDEETPTGDDTNTPPDLSDFAIECMEHGAPGMVVHLLCLLFPQGLPVSCIRHFQQSHPDHASTIDTVLYALETKGLLQKEERYVIREDDLLFPLPAHNGEVDWSGVPQGLRDSHVREVVFERGDWEENHLSLDVLHFNESQDTAELLKSVWDLFVQWVNRYWDTMPHAAMVFSRLYQRSGDLLPFEFDFKLHTENNHQQAILFMDDICELAIWDLSWMEPCDEHWFRAPSFGRQYLQSEGESQLALGPHTVRNIGSNFLNSVISWWIILSEMDVQNIPPKSRLQSVINATSASTPKEKGGLNEFFESLMNPDSTSDQNEKARSLVEIFGIYDYLHCLDWSKYNYDLLHRTYNTVYFTHGWLSKNPNAESVWDEIVVILDLLLSVIQPQHHNEFSFEQFESVKFSTSFAPDDAPTKRIKKQLARVIKYHTYLAKWENQESSRLLRAYISHVRESGNAMMGLTEDELFDVFEHESTMYGRNGALWEHSQKMSPVPLIQMSYEMRDSTAKEYDDPQWLAWYLAQDFSHREEIECVEESCNGTAYTLNGADTLCFGCSEKILQNTEAYLGVPWAAFKRIYLPEESVEQIESKKNRIKLTMARGIANVFISLWTGLKDTDTLTDSDNPVGDEQKFYAKVYEIFDSNLERLDTEMAQYVDNMAHFINHFATEPTLLGTKMHPSAEYWENVVSTEMHADLRSVYTDPSVTVGQGRFIRHRVSSDFAISFSNKVHQIRHHNDLTQFGWGNVGDSRSPWNSALEDYVHHTFTYWQMDEGKSVFMYPVEALLRPIEESRFTDGTAIAIFYPCHQKAIIPAYRNLELRSAYLPLNLEMRLHDHSLENSTPRIYQVGSDVPLSFPIQREWIDPVVEQIAAQQPHQTMYPQRGEEVDWSALNDSQDTLDVLAYIKDRLDVYFGQDLRSDSDFEQLSNFEQERILLYLCFLNSGVRRQQFGESNDNGIVETVLSEICSMIEREWGRVKPLRNVMVHHMQPYQPMEDITLRMFIFPLHDWIEWLIDVLDIPEKRNLNHLRRFDFDDVNPPHRYPIAHKLAHTDDIELLRGIFTMGKSPMIIAMLADQYSSSFIQRFVRVVAPEALRKQINEIAVEMYQQTGAVSRIDELLSHCQYLLMLLQCRNSKLYMDTDEATTIQRILSFENEDVQQILLSVCDLQKMVGKSANRIQNRVARFTELQVEAAFYNQKMTEQQRSIQSAPESMWQILKDRLKNTQQQLKAIEDKLQKQMERYPYLTGMTRISTTPYTSIDEIYGLISRLQQALIGSSKDIVLYNSMQSLTGMNAELNKLFLTEYEEVEPEPKSDIPMFDADRQAECGVNHFTTLLELFIENDIRTAMGEIIQRYPWFEHKVRYADMHLFGNLLFDETKPFHIFYVQVTSKKMDPILRTFTFQQDHNWVLLCAVLSLLESDGLGVQSLIALDYSAGKTGRDAFIETLYDMQGTSFHDNLEEIITLRLSSISNHSEEEEIGISVENWFNEELVPDGYHQKYASKSGMRQSLVDFFQEVCDLTVSTLHDEDPQALQDPSWDFDNYDLNCFTLGLGHVFGDDPDASNSNRYQIVHSTLFQYVKCLRALSNHSLSTARYKLNKHGRMEERETTWFGQLEQERLAIDLNPSTEMKILLQFGAELLIDESAWEEGEDGIFRLQSSHPLPNGTFDAELGVGTIREVFSDFLTWALSIDVLRWKWFRKPNQIMMRGFFTADPPVHDGLIWRRPHAFTWADVYFYKEPKSTSSLEDSERQEHELVKAIAALFSQPEVISYGLTGVVWYDDTVSNEELWSRLLNPKIVECIEEIYTNWSHQTFEEYVDSFEDLKHELISDWFQRIQHRGGFSAPSNCTSKTLQAIFFVIVKNYLKDWIRKRI